VDIACIDGDLVPLAEARIPVTDAGLLRGDGVFEVMRLYDGLAFGRDRHLERMERSAQNLRLELDVAAVARDIDALLASAEPGDALLRVVATRGGHRIALVEPLPVFPRLLHSATSPSPGARARRRQVALLRRQHARHEARARTRIRRRVAGDPAWPGVGAADGIVLLGRRRGRAHAPLSDHVLDSITRRIVLEVAAVKETITTPVDLEAAEEAFVASSVREVIAVRRIEQRDLPPGGPVTRATSDKVNAYIQAELAGQRTAV